MPETLLAIGRTRKTHGVKGEVKCAIEDRFWDAFESLRAVFLPIKDVPTPFFVEQIRGSFPEVIVKLEGMDTPEAAKILCHKEIFARVKDLPKNLPEPEADSGPTNAYLVGYHASDLHAGPLGTIREVQQWPQQEMAVLDINGREVLVPLHQGFIQALDQTQKQVTFDLPEGLLEI